LTIIADPYWTAALWNLMNHPQVLFEVGSDGRIVPVEEINNAMQGQKGAEREEGYKVPLKPRKARDGAGNAK